jgi:pyruvate kinase
MCSFMFMCSMQVGVDYYKQFNFIRYWSTKHSSQPLSHMESMMCSAASMAVLYNEDTTPSMRHKRLKNAACIVCLTETGHPARLITKYRPPSMVFVASTNVQTLRQARLPQCFRIILSALGSSCSELADSSVSMLSGSSCSYNFHVFRQMPLLGWQASSWTLSASKLASLQRKL